MSVTRAQVIAEARKWLGVPFVHQGRSRFGLDCVGLLIVVGRGLGLSDYDVTGYGRTPHAGFLQAECERLMTRVSTWGPGDAVLMRLRREPQHLAILTDRGMIHSYAGAKRVVETSIPPAWAERIVAGYALPGVA